MHFHRRTYKPAVALSTLSLASLASAALVSPSTHRLPVENPLSGTDKAAHSSLRKSINFGPTVHTAHHSEHAPSPQLSAWNNVRAADGLASFSSKCGDGRLDALRCVGVELATSFVKTLHPDDAEFELTDAFTSKHNGLFHAHFRQVVAGIPVANGNLNVNVDLATGEILSYADSSFAANKKAAGSSGKDLWKSRVASWATGAVEQVEQAEQMVFGGKNYADSGPQGSKAKRAIEGAKVADPRHGLLTFLTVQTTSEVQARRILSQPRSQLMTQLWIREPLDESHDLLIDGTPEGLEPTKATLTYVHEGEKLVLTWKFEHQSDDNMYEAYMTADAGIAPGDEEALMVVDWIRDFRPTGGELGSEVMALFGPEGVRETQLIPHLQDRPFPNNERILWRELQDKLEPIPYSGRPSTSDEDEIERLRAVQPSYKVYPWGVNDPQEGKRLVLKGTLVELDADASPAGWHLVPSEYKGGKDTFYYETRGNNVLAQDNPSGGSSMNGFRANGGSNLTFEFPIHMTKPGVPLEPSTYINASVTELFFTNNEIHDLYYRYGFDEESGNFQEHNFGRGGLGGDAVQANAQDGSGYNNANFATPPDGSRPRMRMYIWQPAQPYRDGDFEAGIVIHEYSHGLSTRLTGGPANSGCLGWGEAGGMGEGWGDFLATMIRMHNVNVTDYDMGGWASNRPNGIRYYRYSRNMTENPSTYKYLDKSGYWGVHAIGEVWAEFLFELAENLIDDYGFHPTLFPPPVNGTDSTGYYDAAILKETGKRVPAHGNTLAVQLVIDGMKIQPCRPSFQNARDAILTADKALTGGKNACTIWKSFAKRGLGPAAKVVGSTPWGGGIRTEDYEFPTQCKDKKGGKGKKGKKDRKTTF
ncbi:hypothetical protein JCM8097_001235 [Rhodosporidiobolus ruineniae]